MWFNPQRGEVLAVATVSREVSLDMELGDEAA